MITENPAFLKVVVLLTDIFSLAEIEAPKLLLDKLQAPNFFSNYRQFVWDYMFWQVVGTSILEVEDNNLKPNSQLNWLNLGNIEIPEKLYKDLSNRILSEKKYNDVMEQSIIYHEIEQDRKIKLKNLVIFNDLTATTTNILDSLSRVDALYKIVSNSNVALESKNRNLHFTKKFLISGRISPDNITELPMGSAEKDSITDSVNNKQKDIYPVKVPVDVQRFTDNLRNLALDESYMADYYKIGKMYSIPRDVLEAFEKGSTYENQEKARASMISYSLQAKGNNFIEGLARFYGFKKDDVSISWDHLPFNQVFEKDRSETNHKNSLAYKALIDAGMSDKEAKEQIYDN